MMTPKERKAYLHRALAQAVIEKLPGDEGYVATVPALPGVIATGQNRAAVRAELPGVIAEWIKLGESQGHRLPDLGD